MSIRRIFVEKKEGFDIPAKRVLKDVKEVLKIDAQDLRIFLRYDIEGIEDGDFGYAVENVFSEPPCDRVYYEELPELNGYSVFGVEYLKGQYDQRADSAGQCVELLLNKNRPLVATATVYAVKGVDENEVFAIQKYLINPTDSKLSEDEKPESLVFESEEKDEILYVSGFKDMTFDSLKRYHKENGFAMSLNDLKFVQDYFKSVNRDPTVTEIKVIDTYWSDHCRHTTFLTELTDIDTGDNTELKEGYALYKRLFKELYKNRPEKYVCLMDIATIGAKALKREGKLGDLDESEEINACSIKVKAKIDGKEEDWLVMFKNETHNHPTEIEPFGGAATCLGGAIRDPLSGRVYVYQAMRITGAGDVFKDIKDTLPGKLPQRVISKTAAAGFSSYGNQIGLATGAVHEIYHDNYAAKRLETGFVIGAAPAENVVRSKPQKGDKIILLGGETGRDGCGGATGSSKAHNKESVTVCGAEVQKGNPLTERKIQRFFRNSEATRLIKKCNDFGAGGVCVAIGELADGLDIYLDRVPKKYKGLTVTETAISESQERMAVVTSEKDAERFLKLAEEENLSATVVAEVTDTNKLRMYNKGNLVVDIDRSFLNTNGVKQTAGIACRNFKTDGVFDVYSEETKISLEKSDYKGALYGLLKDKNVMIQKGQSEMFDSTIGAGSVFMPFGGKYQLTPSLIMAAKLPLIKGSTQTASVASWAFNPYITDANPYLGGIHAVLASVAKLVASGVDYRTVRLTLQEYFKRLNGDKERFGEPFAALLGALFAQYNLGTAAIGGKDSMSGTYEDIDVPNTLISFAVSVTETSGLIGNVFKSGQRIYRLPLYNGIAPDFEYVKKVFDTVHKEIKNKNITAATVSEHGGAVAAAIKSACGNMLGVRFFGLSKPHFEARLGDILVAVKDENALKGINYELLAETDDSGNVVFDGGEISIQEAVKLLSGHEKIYPVTKKADGEAQNTFGKTEAVKHRIFSGAAKPTVLIPVFPGTNCEYDTAKRFEQEGAKVNILVIRNNSAGDIRESVKELIKAIDSSQILAFPGGFSGGDEPDGSGKFIAATFRNPYITESVMNLLNKRDGLILGICNGFQALIKLGLLPYGKIGKLTENSPTLTFNAINRHVSSIVRTRIASTASPWLSSFKVGDVFAVPVSHGEGRFTSNEQELKKIIENGQIATQYVDFENNATMESPFNPNGSLYAVEGLISEDGRIFGKMGHTERYQKDLYKNIDADFDMNIFKNGVKYFI